MKIQSSILWAFALILSMATPVLFAGAGSDETADEVRVNAIASNAFLVLRDVPAIGLEKSAPALEQTIADHHRLSQSSLATDRHFSLVLADAVAHAIISEILRAEFARQGIDQGRAVKSIPFDKQIAVRLWRANMPDFAPLIRKAMKGEDVLTGYISKHSSEEEVLGGDMIDKAPWGQVKERIRKLNREASVPLYVQKNPTPDEQLIYALNKCQAFQDLTIIVDLYEKGDLPGGEWALVRPVIDGVLKNYPQRRVDNGMKASSVNVWSTSARYLWDPSERDLRSSMDQYSMEQSLLLGPFMADMDLLPDLAKEFLLKMAESKKTAPISPGSTFSE